MSESAHQYPGSFGRHRRIIELLVSSWAALNEGRKQAIRTAEQIETRWGLPVLAQIPHSPRTYADCYAPQLVTVQTPDSPVTKVFRNLWTNVQRATIDRPLRRLLVTGPGDTTGKSTRTSHSIVAANLAVIMAQAGREVVLLEADPQQTQVSGLFAQGTAVGWREIVRTADRPWVTALKLTAVRGLMTVAGDSRPADAAHLSDAPHLSDAAHLQTFLGHLQEISDMIFVDGPTLPVPDIMALARQVDGVLLVIDYGTPGRVAHQAVRQLQASGARMVGVVLKGVPAVG